MKTIDFKMCADCVNKQFVNSDTNGRAIYYCALVDGIVHKGIVYDSTDATVCIKEDLFRPVDNKASHN